MVEVETRECSRSRSPEHRKPRKKSEWPFAKPPVDEITYYPVEGREAAWLVGKDGKTKQKIATVCQVEMHLDDDHSRIELMGDEQNRLKAFRCLQLVSAQRESPTIVQPDPIDDGNLTIVNIPNSTVAYVTGSKGSFLNMIQQEWNVLMLFATITGHEAPDNQDSLLIYGDPRNRRGAELKIQSTVESKEPGFFSQHHPDSFYSENEGFDTDYHYVEKDMIGFALGPKGLRRRKISNAAHCIVEYIDNMIAFAGTKEERVAALRYLEMLIAIKETPDLPQSLEGRTDVTEVIVPRTLIPFVTGAGRKAMDSVEQEFGVLMYFTNIDMTDDADVTLLVFGTQRSRDAAELKVKSLCESKSIGLYTSGMEERNHPNDDYGLDVIKLPQEEVSLAVGPAGINRQRISQTTNCVLQYVGPWAHFIGTGKERALARQYLEWILAIARKEFVLKGLADRDDISIVPLGVGNRLLNKTPGINVIERECSVCIMICKNSNGVDQLVIASPDRGIFSARSGRRGAEGKCIRLIGDYDQGLDFTMDAISAQVNANMALLNSSWGGDGYKGKGKGKGGKGKGKGKGGKDMYQNWGWDSWGYGGNGKGWGWSSSWW